MKALSRLAVIALSAASIMVSILLFAMLLVDRMVGGALPGLSIDLSAGG